MGGGAGKNMSYEYTEPGQLPGNDYQYPGSRKDFRSDRLVAMHIEQSVRGCFLQDGFDHFVGFWPVPDNLVDVFFELRESRRHDRDHDDLPLLVQYSIREPVQSQSYEHV